MVQECPYCHIYVNQIERHILSVHDEEMKFNLHSDITKSVSDAKLVSHHPVNFDLGIPPVSLSHSVDELDYLKESYTNDDNCPSFSHEKLICRADWPESFISTVELNKSYENRDSSDITSGGSSFMDDSIDTGSTSYQLTDSLDNRDFKTTVLQLLSNDEIGRLCKTDQALNLLGECLYHRLLLVGRVNSSAETVSHMRILAALYVEFRKCALNKIPLDEIHFMAMFEKENFSILKKTLGNAHLNNDFPDVRHKYCSILRITLDMLKNNQLFGYRDRLSPAWDEYLKEIESGNGAYVEYSLDEISESDYQYRAVDDVKNRSKTISHHVSSPAISIKNIDSLKESYRFKMESPAVSLFQCSSKFHAQPISPSHAGPVSPRDRSPVSSTHNFITSSLQLPSMAASLDRSTIIRRKTPIPFENQSKSGRRRYLRWKAEDTTLILDLFAKYIEHEDEGCKGSLPGMGELRTFCSRYPLESLSGLDLAEACKALKVKVFNERKKLREKLALERNRLAESLGGGRSFLNQDHIQKQANSGYFLKQKIFEPANYSPSNEIANLIANKKFNTSDLLFYQNSANISSEVTIHPTSGTHRPPNIESPTTTAFADSYERQEPTTSTAEQKDDFLEQHPKSLPSMSQFNVPNIRYSSEVQNQLPNKVADRILPPSEQFSNSLGGS